MNVTAASELPLLRQKHRGQTVLRPTFIYSHSNPFSWKVKTVHENTIREFCTARTAAAPSSTPLTKALPELGRHWTPGTRRTMRGDKAVVSLIGKPQSGKKVGRRSHPRAARKLPSLPRDRRLARRGTREETRREVGFCFCFSFSPFFRSEIIGRKHASVRHPSSHARSVIV